MEKSQRNTIGERIKEIRQHCGMSQHMFGEKINVKASSVSRLESGQNKPSKKTLRAICQAFGVRLDWLLSGEGPAFIPCTTEEEHIDKILDGDDEQKNKLIRKIAMCDSDAVVEVCNLYFDFLIESKQTVIAEALKLGAVGEGVKGIPVPIEDIYRMYSALLTNAFQEILLEKYYPGFVFAFPDSDIEEKESNNGQKES